MESSDFSPSGTNARGGDSMHNAAASGLGASEQPGGLADKARGALDHAGAKLSDAGSTVRERAATAKDSLADALAAGAEKLRARGGDGSMAAAGATGGAVAVTDDRVAQVTTKVAGGMDAASEWLRDADLNGLKAGVEQQVKEHPGRTLLIAIGVGYLLGKALRK
jgi:ElaB/YqjD/DUF883 family membrane-anchored ribosome-binding protein